MSELFERIIRTWTTVPTDDAAAREAFGQHYTDPVLINTVPTSLDALVASARALNRTFEGLRRDIVTEVDAGDRLVAVFRMSGRHTGPLGTPLGEVAPTGLMTEVLVIDVFTLVDGKVSEVWVAANQLDQLTGLGVLALRDTEG